MKATKLSKAWANAGDQVTMFFLVVSLIVLEVGVSFFFRLERSVVIDHLKSTAKALYSKLPNTL